MSKVILQEYLSPLSAKSKVTLEEGTDSFGNKAKKLYMEGIFIQGDIRNANERIYPVREIQRAVDTINDQLANGISICGEVDHPDDLKINLDRVSHCITKMDMDGSNGIGKLQILPTPMGQLVTTMLESGVKLGVSSRGSGNVNDYDGRVSDFEIITVDIVAQPSAPNAYPKAIYEGALNSKVGYKLLEAMKNGDILTEASLKKYIQKEIFRLIEDLKI